MYINIQYIQSFRYKNKITCVFGLRHIYKRELKRCLLLNKFCLLKNKNSSKLKKHIFANVK